MGIQFGVFHHWTRISKSMFNSDQLGQKAIGNFCAGSLAGFFVLPVLHPLSRLHVPFKLPSGSTAPGWARFMHYYDGFQEAAIPTLVHKGLYFGLYETLKPILIEDPDRSPIKSLMLATATSYTALVVAHPFQVIRRRTCLIDQSIRPRGWRVARDIFRQEGLRGLYRGPFGFISALMGAMVLVGYDQTRSALHA